MTDHTGLALGRLLGEWHRGEIPVDVALARVATAVEEARADAWDEALQAVAWCLNNEATAVEALDYVVRNNPHRAASAGPGAGDVS